MSDQILYIDRHPWIVERQHETVLSAVSPARTEQRLFLFFHGPGGELRRGEIPDDFTDDPSADVLERAWRYAEVVRPAERGEMRSETELVVPRVRDLLRLFWRAVRLRCPYCGGKPVLRSWFVLRERCPACGLRMERGEREDYFLGGILFNLFLAELLFAVLFTGVVVALWPDVPWDGLEYGIAVAMVAAPIALYPVSKLLWLAFDLALRPVTPAEMAWHHENEGGERGDTAPEPMDDHRAP